MVMPAGIQIYDENGTLTFDMSKNVCHLLGSFTIPKNTGAGSKTVPINRGHTLFCYCICDTPEFLQDIAINGNTINYMPNTQITPNSDAIIYYGEF